MESRKSDRVSKSGDESGESAVSCSEDLSPDEKSGAGAQSPVMDVKIPALDKYNLRMKSIQNRIELEKKKKTPVKKQPKAKQRPVPLSKYRRRTANARERTRMQVTHHNSWLETHVRSMGVWSQRRDQKSSSSVNLPFVRSHFSPAFRREGDFSSLSISRYSVTSDQFFLFFLKRYSH